MPGRSVPVPNGSRFRSPRAAWPRWLGPCLALGLALGAAPGGAGADEAASVTSERPRVGLVLSGGGARGAAHIGVLEVLEELRIPIDVIAGTSMGAVVGGLYASGIEVDELEELIAELPWDELFQDKTRRRDMSFRRKQDDRTFISDLHFGFKDGSIQIPTGLIQGQKLELTLGLLTLPVATVRDFDDLTLPFRAVATDIVTGEAVVLEGGELADAIRASMAIPGAFAPVELDGRLLVDGGTSMNLPVEVAKMLGADVVIAVDIATPLRTREQLSNALSITGQTVTLQIQQNTEEQVELLGEDDFLIRPELGEVATMSFDRVEQAADAGALATSALRDFLAPLSVDEATWRAYRSGLVRPGRAPPVIDEIRVDNDSVVSDDVIRSRMQVEVGQPLDYETLARDIDVLHGMGFFDRVNFRIDPLPGGRNQLLIIARKRATGRDRLRFGFELETDFVSNSLFNIGIGLMRLPVNSLAAEWRSELRIGQDPAIWMELWQPIDDETRWFVAPTAYYDSSTLGIFDDFGNGLAEYRVHDVGGGIGFGRQLGQWGEARAGIRYDWARAEVLIGDPAFFPRIERTDGELFVRFAVDTLDNARFPRSGWLLLAEGAVGLEELGSTGDFQSLFVAGGHARSWGKNTLVAEVQAALSFESDTTFSNLYSLGGFLRLSGLKPDERVGTDMLLFRVRGYRRVAKLGLLSFTLPAYVGLSIESGNTWFGTNRISGSSLLWGGSAYVALDTPLAPVYIAYGNTDGNRHAAYFFLGQVF